LVADTVPPSVNVIQTRVLVYRALFETDRGKREELFSKMRQARKQFEEAYERDVRSLPDGQLKAALSGPLHETAEEYFDVVDRAMIPALQQGDTKRTNEARLQLIDIGGRNQQAADEIVKLSSEYGARIKQEAASTVTSRTWVMFLVGFGSAGFILIAGYLIGRSISQPLNTIVARLKDISEGEGDLT